MFMIPVDEYKERILDEATELFRIYGTKAVTMDHLAQELGMSKRTIYEKFKDKDELLAAVLMNLYQKQKETIDKFINSESNVLIALFKHGRIMKDFSNSLNPVFKSDIKRFHRDTLKRLKENVKDNLNNVISFAEKGIEQGVLRDDINPEIVDRCMQGLSDLMNDNELFPSDEFRQQELVKNILIYYLRGIASEEGLKVIALYERDYS